MENCNSYQCRICLADGNVPIFEDEDSSIAEDIVIFGDIQIHKNDEFPQHLCDSCLKLLLSCIAFRNSAKHSDQLLKNSVYADNNDSVDSYIPSVSETNTQDDECDTESMAPGTVYSDYVSNIDPNELSSQRETELESLSEYDEIHQCDLCEISFKSQNDYQTHMSTDDHVQLAKRSSQTSCQICSELVPQEKYEKHFHKHNTDEAQALNMLECVECDLHFDTMEDFEEHCKSDIHQNSLNRHKVKCTICEKFITKHYFKTHVKLHGDEEERKQLLRKCSYCEKSVVYSYFNAHIQRVHGDKIKIQELSIKKQPKTERSEYICDKCGKVLKNQHNLNLHALTHGSEMKYKCMFCPYRGLHAGLLKIHIRTHTKDYNYKCTQCPAKFLTKSNLSKHLQRHEGSGKFQCENCEKCFYSKSELKRHNEANHLGIKQHICNICGKAFTCRNYMMCHQLKVHKRKRLTDGKGRVPSYLTKERNSENSTNNQDFIT